MPPQVLPLTPAERVVLDDRARAFESRLSLEPLLQAMSLLCGHFLNSEDLAPPHATPSQCLECLQPLDAAAAVPDRDMRLAVQTWLEFFPDGDYAAAPIGRQRYYLAHHCCPGAFDPCQTALPRALLAALFPRERDRT